MWSSWKVINFAGYKRSLTAEGREILPEVEILSPN